MASCLFLRRIRAILGRRARFLRRRFLERLGFWNHSHRSRILYHSCVVMYVAENRITDRILAGVVGLATHNGRTTDTAFDILSLEALLLVPRYARHDHQPGRNENADTANRACSLLSLHPFFGPLVSDCDSIMRLKIAKRTRDTLLKGNGKRI